MHHTREINSHTEIENEKFRKRQKSKTLEKRHKKM